MQQTLIFMIGLTGGSLANYVIYRFAYFQPRKISPWGPTPTGTQREWFDRIPCLGWLGLRREWKLHGRGFWIRPLMIELLLPIGLLWLYRFEYLDQGLWPAELRSLEHLSGYQNGAASIFWTHVVLVVLMTAATFIDFDERTIPDVITIPGTCLGLLLAASSLQIFMPTTVFIEGVPYGGPTTFDSPWFHADSDSLAASECLMVGLSIWSTWCFALTDWRWSSALCRRRGFFRGEALYSRIISLRLLENPVYYLVDWNPWNLVGLELAGGALARFVNRLGWNGCWWWRRLDYPNHCDLGVECRSDGFW